MLMWLLMFTLVPLLLLKLSVGLTSKYVPPPPPPSYNFAFRLKPVYLFFSRIFFFGLLLRYFLVQYLQTAIASILHLLDVSIAQFKAPAQLSLASKNDAFLSVLAVAVVTGQVLFPILLLVLLHKNTGKLSQP